MNFVRYYNINGKKTWDEPIAYTLSLRGAKRRSNLNKAHKLRQEIASLTLAMTTF